MLLIRCGLFSSLLSKINVVHNSDGAVTLHAFGMETMCQGMNPSLASF
jgi:hypothetical protein